MGKQERKLGDVERKYRIAVRDRKVNDEVVREQVKSELGNNVHVTGWEIERQIRSLEMGYVVDIPHRETLVTLRYKEFVSGLNN